MNFFVAVNSFFKHEILYIDTSYIRDISILFRNFIIFWFKFYLCQLILLQGGTRIIQIYHTLIMCFAPIPNNRPLKPLTHKVHSPSKTVKILKSNSITSWPRKNRLNFFALKRAKRQTTSSIKTASNTVRISERDSVETSETKHGVFFPRTSAVRVLSHIKRVESATWEYQKLLIVHSNINLIKY